MTGKESWNDNPQKPKTSIYTVCILVCGIAGAYRSNDWAKKVKTLNLNLRGLINWNNHSCGNYKHKSGVFGVQWEKVTF